MNSSYPSSYAYAYIYIYEYSYNKLLETQPVFCAVKFLDLCLSLVWQMIPCWFILTLIWEQRNSFWYVFKPFIFIFNELFQFFAQFSVYSFSYWLIILYNEEIVSFVCAICGKFSPSLCYTQVCMCTHTHLVRRNRYFLVVGYDDLLGHQGFLYPLDALFTLGS